MAAILKTGKTLRMRLSFRTPVPSFQFFHSSFSVNWFSIPNFNSFRSFEGVPSKTRGHYM